VAAWKASLQGRQAASPAPAVDVYEIAVYVHEHLVYIYEIAVYVHGHLVDVYEIAVYVYGHLVDVHGIADTSTGIS